MAHRGKIKTDIVIYQSKSGAIELRTDLKAETFWATQAQMASVFGVNPQAITRHLKNIYGENELSKEATCSKMEQVQDEGGREVKRTVTAYNLDAIISVGYRINSAMATKFRQWATKTLRTHITDGFTINRKRLASNYDTFLKAVDEVKDLIPSGGQSQVGTGDALELVKLFASTWLSLSAYDREDLPKKGITKRQVRFTADQLQGALAQMKAELLGRGEATDLFGRERSADSVGGIVGTVFQTFGGKPLYATAEERAAHLLYFMVKNHPYADGNKRSGAFSFVWFLNRAKLLDASRISPEALTALTLLVAESQPKEKDRVIGLVLLLLRGGR
jgi:hypothetical protein